MGVSMGLLDLRAMTGADQAEKWSEGLGMDGAPEGPEDAARHLDWMSGLTDSVSKKLQAMGLPEQVSRLLGANVAKTVGSGHELEGLAASAMQAIKEGSLSPL